MPYEADAVERFGAAGEPKPHSSDMRSPFARDRDRVLYSTSFRQLAGKSQVAAAAEAGLFHTRLTHCLKVGQLGRRLSERLGERYVANGGALGSVKLVPPDADLVEAACLAHDLGHPPFGHVGEAALHQSFNKLAAKMYEASTQQERAALGGFEGNAQTFRLLTYLSARIPLAPRCGLDLTRATLDGTTKYPRLRTDGDPKKITKWGAYGPDAPKLDWVRNIQPAGPLANACFEARLMDWCDDVTYAVHDVLDFYRAGYIPLNRLLALEGGVSRKPQLTDEAFDFLEREVPATEWTGEEMEAAWTVLAELSDINQPWEPTLRGRAAVQAATSHMITFFTDGVGWRGDAPCRYEGFFVIDPSSELSRLKETAAGLLKQLLRVRVIDQPALRTQQKGQTVIVARLINTYVDDPDLLPPDRREDIADHGDPLRAAADHVASLTEQDAQALYRRVAGVELGALTDIL